MTRPGTETVRLIDELTANATAATTAQLVDGWLLRAAPEYPFRRCNSVLPHGGNRAGLAARIDLVEDFYRERDLPARFQISPAVLPVGLDDALESRGYEIEEPTLVLVAETPRVIAQTMRADTGDVTLGEAAGRMQGAGDTGLHVPRAAAVEAAVLDVPVPEPVCPLAQRRHHVHMAGQEQRATAARAAAAADHAGAALVAASRPPQRVGDGGLDLVRPEHVDLGAGLVQARRN